MYYHLNSYVLLTVRKVQLLFSVIPGKNTAQLVQVVEKTNLNLGIIDGSIFEQVEIKCLI